MPFQNNVLAGASAQGGYQITNSLRFRWSNTGYLSRTAGASPTNDKIFTWAGWVKLGLPVTNNADYGVLFTGYTASSDAGFGVLTVSNPVAGFPAIRVGGWATNYRITSAAFRDPSAWYHIVMAVDTTQATAADRIKLYVNGTQITSFGTSNNPALNATMGFNNASSTQRIGLDAPASSAYHFDGYMAHVYFIDGQALTPSSFGQTDAATGVWVPKAYSGTFGTNGFFLQFKNATSTTTIGYDTSGNSNHFTTSGISVTAGGTFDQSLDTPTLNYPVISPLNSQSVVSITEAGMASNYGGASNTGTCIVSVPFPTTGKWYYEHTCLAVGAYDYFCGVFLNKSIAGNAGNIVVPSTSSNEYAYRFTGEKMIAGVVSAYGSSYTANDVIGVAFDATNLTIEFFKNNVSQGQLTGMPSGEYIAFTQQYGGGSTRINFGQRAFAYTPPSGFKALNTANLASTAVTTSGSFTGNAAANGPFVWTNGNPATLTINGNAVTFGTHADKTAGGFKLRTSSASYNASGSNSWTATAGKRFVQSKKPNNAQQQKLKQQAAGGPSGKMEGCYAMSGSCLIAFHSQGSTSLISPSKKCSSCTIKTSIKS